jgi:hypothetical protein
MRAIVLISMLLAIFSASPCDAAQASLHDRSRMSVAIADYIRDAGKSNDFKTDLVKLGPTVVEGNWALADWQSEDGKRRGQVSFFYVCDSWSVGKVELAQPFRVRDLTGHHFGDVPEKTAAKLVTDLKQVEKLHVAYLKPAHAELGC